MTEELKKEPRVLHLGLGVPSLDMVHADFMISLIGVANDIKSIPIEGYDMARISLINVRSSTIAKQRQDIAEDALRQGCTHLLWVDSDQVFPPDTARRLILSGKQVIGCNIAVKRIPSLPTARRYVEKWPLTGDVVYSDESKKGLEKIWKLGFGVMMTEMSIYKDLPKPYFNFGWNDVTGFVGEDWYFCDLLWRKGIELWIDHDLSREVYHAGTYLFGHRDVDHTETDIKIIRPDDITPDQESV